MYGELASIEEYVRVLRHSRNLGPEARFVDLGSGLGKPTAVAASIFNCKVSLGIENIPKLYATSEAVRHFLEHTASVKEDRLQFHLGNLHRCRALWISADVIYVCCLTWSRKSIRLLYDGLTYLKRGSEVFTSVPIRDKFFRLRTEIEARGSWGRTRIYLYDKTT